jgi:putative acyl-CoA dehydrogenase
VSTDPPNEDWNQPPPLADYSAWAGDPVLQAAVKRCDAEWIVPRAEEMGTLVGSEAFQGLAHAANHYVPELRTHDRYGQRVDTVLYHPAYHRLMSFAFRAGLHSLAWTAHRSGAYAARAALNYLWNQGENGTACPVTMTFAAVRVMRHRPELAASWEPKLLACDYDPRPLPVEKKRAVTVGMAMTERQGGSDLRAIRTRAQPSGDHYLLEGHKWFCSVPMSDGFFTLARTEGGVTCFFVPRTLPEGRRNAFLIQRLKDKCGNRSNASAEIEYHGTHAARVGEEGRGIATLIEMAHFTRFDIVVATAGMMRAVVVQALHHARHRSAFGKRLAEQPLMQNVLADLALEAEAAALLAFRLAAAFDRAEEDEQERQLARVLTPLAKYWVCKRMPGMAAEAMECLGGDGYVEEAPLARFYREAPLNGIWEGSGNVICLDVLRSLERQPEAARCLFHEIGEGGERLALARRDLERLLAAGEAGARRFVEQAALAMQASLMLRYAPERVADAYCQARLGAEGGRQFGTLPTGSAFAAIIERALPLQT